MNKYPIRLTQLVHENLSTVMTYAYSRIPLIVLMQDKFPQFPDGWKYLEKALFEISNEKANRAITELAMLLRIIDDEEQITHHHTLGWKPWPCGNLLLKNGDKIQLTIREFANKIIHAKTFDWKLEEGKHPKVICYSRENNRKWDKAEVDLVALAGFCGGLTS